MKSQNNIAIMLTRVSKNYEIHHDKPTLVEKFVKKNNEVFKALNSINITIRKGEKVGIVGHNGSGKTTLLKIIARITTPTYGTIETQGRIVSLIDLEAGFHPDLTGIQNIYLNGMLIGMKKEDIDKKLSSIIQFADIKQFIDVPLYTYSFGMKLRLGFSIAIHSNPQILLLDESIGVGDKQFQIKVQKKIKQLFTQGITILVVSHWLQFVEEHCKRIVIMKNGSIIQDGGKNVLKQYQNSKDM